MKNRRLFKLLAMVIALSLMMPMTAFAMDREEEIGDDYSKAKLMFFDTKEELTDLVDKDIKLISISEDNEYEFTIKPLTAFVVDINSKVHAVRYPNDLEYELSVYKLTQRDDAYTYIYGQTLEVTDNAVVFNEIGDYYIDFNIDTQAEISEINLFVRVIGDEIEEVVEEEVVEEPIVKKAKPTASKVLVNGVDVSFEAYLIDGFNYFKLRDLAQVVKGTEKQFEVSWDADNSIIVLTSNQEYTSQGVELTEGDGLEKEATLNKSKVMIDGVEVEFEAYTINGLNYFKLRDIAKAFDVGVTYTPETAEIGLDTTIGYTE